MFAARAIRIGFIAWAAIVLLAGSSLPVDAGTGTLRISFAKAGLFVGAGTATGTLHFHGRTYPLSIRGVSVGTIGVALTRLTGHAYNLRHGADIVGSYSAVSASIAVVGGAKVARLRHSNGVVYLQLEGPQAGLELSTAAAGMTISLAD
jgi:hypothetical protein